MTDVKPSIRAERHMIIGTENPFEAMMSRFDHAARLLNLDEGLYKVLRAPEKQITVSIPIKLDNGKLAGTVVVKDHEDQFSGKWTAQK